MASADLVVLYRILARLSLLALLPFPAPTAQSLGGVMAFSHLRSAAYRRGCVWSRSASFISISNPNKGRRPVNILAAKSANHHSHIHMPILPTMLFSSSVSTDGNDASVTSPLPQPPNASNGPDRGGPSWSNYERLVRKLYMTNLFNPVKLGLENMDKLHKVLGSPMDQVRAHVMYCNVL